MHQCVGSRGEERNYCSRVCCTQAIKNALRVKLMEFAFLLSNSNSAKFRKIQIIFHFQEMICLFMEGIVKKFVMNIRILQF